MSDLECTRAGFLDHAVDCVTMLTFPSLPAAFVDALSDLRSSQIIESWATHFTQKCTALRLGKENPRAFLADFLEDPDDALEISHMESWQNKSDVTKMTIAFLQMIAAGLAHGGLVRNTHARIERAMSNESSVMFEIEKLSVGNFHDGLADNIVIRPEGRKSLR